MITTLVEQVSKLLGSAYLVSALTPWLIFWLANVVTLVLALGPLSTLRLWERLATSTAAVSALTFLGLVFLILGALLVASLTTVFTAILQGRHLGPPLGLFLRGRLHRMQRRAREYEAESERLFDEWMAERAALEGLSALTSAYVRSTGHQPPKPAPKPRTLEAIARRFNRRFGDGSSRADRTAAADLLELAYERYAASAFEKQHKAVFDAAGQCVDEAREAYAALERQRAETFADVRQVAPTDYGNAIAASEAYVWRVYGIESAVLWTRLQTVVSKEHLATVSDAKVRLDFFTAMTLFAGSYGVIWFFALPYLWPSAPMLVALVAVVAMVTWVFYRAAVAAAAGFGEVFRASFDLFRRALLTAMSMQPPGTLAEERALWSRLSSIMVFHQPPSTDDDLALAGTAPKAPASTARFE